MDDTRIFWLRGRKSKIYYGQKPNLNVFPTFIQLKTKFSKKKFKKISQNIQIKEMFFDIKTVNVIDMLLCCVKSKNNGKTVLVFICVSN